MYSSSFKQLKQDQSSLYRCSCSLHVGAASPMVKYSIISIRSIAKLASDYGFKPASLYFTVSVSQIYNQHYTTGSFAVL